MIVKHVLPNSLSSLIVTATMGVASSILMAAGLSYVGLGVQPPTPEWGAMLSESRNYIRDYPHMVIFPGLLIAITVLSFNMLGDGLRDALDPKLKR
jgi:peptide/nickel transport system permease protein